MSTLNVPEITLELKTVQVEAKRRSLPIRKNFFSRLPRKIKKTLKKEKGVEGFANWMNEPVKYVIGEPIIGGIEENEAELITILEKELKRKITKQKK